MRNLLAAAQRDVLSRLAESNVVLGFDYDGTLAPEVADPAEGDLPASTRRLLRALARRYPCVVITGRAMHDVERRLVGIGLQGVSGNHGLEPWCASEALRRRVRGWKAELAPALAGLTGVDVEDKTYSLSIHYRRARPRKLAQAAILRAAATLGRARVVGGKQVVNVIPREAPHKGQALERERVRLGCERAFFMGDDLTDEDVFASDRSERLISVRVGARRSSQASYFIPDQRAVDELLRRLVELRRRAARRGAR